MIFGDPATPLRLVFDVNLISSAVSCVTVTRKAPRLVKVRIGREGLDGLLDGDVPLGVDLDLGPAREA
jgi:hypothetical protein